MKLLIIRHGDPDYSIDSLTEKGWQEAGFLAERIAKLDVKEFYVSPLGRARDTVSLTLKKMNRTATECSWLREFEGCVWRPDVTGHKAIAWDWLPQDWTKEERFYRLEQWDKPEVIQESNVREKYDWVIDGLDAVLEKHGYIRDGHYYRTEQGNNDTIVFFCHFGVEAVMLSHLLGVSPMVFLHNLCAAPTSVTTVITEERRKGIASFRMSAFGDVSHLYAHDEEPSFSARFCECYENQDERHD